MATAPTTRAGGSYAALAPYLVAILSALAALSLTYVLVPDAWETPSFVLASLAVMVSAWYGGWKPGLLATSIGLLGSAYFLPPVGSMIPEPADWGRIASFLLSALLICAFISALRSARESQQRAEAGYRSLVEHAPFGIYRSSFDGDRFLAVNPALVRMLGYDSAEEVLQLRPAEQVYRDVVERHRALDEAQRAGVFRNLEVTWLKKDGSQLLVRLNGQRVIAADGTQELEVFAEDVTEASQLQAQFLQAQKMESIGQLAGGIAHDFNNLLTVIMGANTFLLEGLAADSKLRRFAEQVEHTAQRTAALVGQLLAFSRRQVLAPRILDLNEVLASTMKMLPRLLGEHIEVAFLRRSGPHRVKVDPGQLEQVILNLAVNARDAMPHGGKLTIETASVYLDEAYARQHPSVTPGSYVQLAISDNGIGMDEATRTRIFEPFFTTKEKGKGTGLGLSTVYGIVKQSGGHIWVYSEPGGGTTFKLYFAKVEEREEASTQQAAPARASRGTETILLVEDEPALREVAADFLTARGYAVLQAEDGEKALRLAATHPGPIHLLVTDLVMPRMSGRELADRLLAARPEAKVLFISGYTDDAVVRHGALQPGTAYLQKPFSLEALGVRLREMLGGEADAPAST